MNPTTPSIPLAAATKVFGGAQWSVLPCVALRGISLAISRGEYVDVLEKSGSGTSTLRNLIAGLERPTSGVIQVAGTELAGISETRWFVGAVLQFFLLLPTLTVFAMSITGE